MAVAANRIWTRPRPFQRARLEHPRACARLAGRLPPTMVWRRRKPSPSPIVSPQAPAVPAMNVTNVSHLHPVAEVVREAMKFCWIKRSALAAPNAVGRAAALPIGPLERARVQALTVYRRDMRARAADPAGASIGSPGRALLQNPRPHQAEMRLAVARSSRSLSALSFPGRPPADLHGSRPVMIGRAPAPEHMSARRLGTAARGWTPVPAGRHGGTHAAAEVAEAAPGSAPRYRRLPARRAGARSDAEQHRPSVSEPVGAGVRAVAPAVTRWAGEGRRQIAASSPVALDWRKPAASPRGDAPATQDLPPAALDAATVAQPQVALSGASKPSPTGAVPVTTLDPSLAERLTDDVIRRLERRARIERERRGL